MTDPVILTENEEAYIAAKLEKIAAMKALEAAKQAVGAAHVKVTIASTGITAASATRCDVIILQRLSATKWDKGERDGK